MNDFVSVDHRPRFARGTRIDSVQGPSGAYFTAGMN